MGALSELGDGAAPPYLPLKSALAPKQQQHNITNFIHKPMISRLRLVLPVIQKGEETTEDEDGVPLTHAEGAQVGRALPAFLQTGRCWSGTSAQSGSGDVSVRVLVCGGTHSVGKRAHSSRPFFLRLHTQVQPAAPPASSPYCSQIFISALFVPGRPAADNPPAAYPGRNATSRPEQPTGASRRSSEGLMLRKGSQ